MLRGRAKDVALDRDRPRVAAYGDLAVRRVRHRIRRAEHRAADGQFTENARDDDFSGLIARACGEVAADGEARNSARRDASAECRRAAAQVATDFDGADFSAHVELRA